MCNPRYKHHTIQEIQRELGTQLGIGVKDKILEQKMFLVSYHLGNHLEIIRALGVLCHEPGAASNIYFFLLSHRYVM